ncbi:MAG: dethiobiotin synthase, partial [Pseudomonadota bacterium]
LTVQSLLNDDQDKIIPEKYIFGVPVSPHLAANMEKKDIFVEEFNVPQISNGRIIIEGAGGVLVPLNDRDTILSLVKYLKLPVIIVSSTRIGTINHTCLTIEAIRRENIAMLGVIMNGSKNEDNKLAIEKYGKVTVLDEIEPFKTLDYITLKNRKPSEKLLEVINDFSSVR